MMRIISNKWIPPKGFLGLNLFGLLFVRKEARLTNRFLRHELVHTSQMKEMLFIGFYIWYVLEWMIKLTVYGKKAYENIGFEREARLAERDLTYRASRKFWGWFKYVWEKPEIPKETTA